MKLTVFFENGFWYGLLEDESDGRIRAIRERFGSEPHDAEVLYFVRHRMMSVIESVSRSVSSDARLLPRLSPKRLQRAAAEELRSRGPSSRAEEAWKLELAHRKAERRSLSRAQKEEAKAKRRAIAVQKAKDRHRGR